MENKTGVTVLCEEIEYFNEIKQDLLKRNSGQFALIKGREFFGAFTKSEEAYSEGIRRFGITSFLVRQINEVETIEKIPALHIGFVNASF